MAVLFLVSAVVLMAGGARVKSAPSLIAGSVSGVLAAAAPLTLHHPRSGWGLGILLSLAKAVFFFGRFQRTRKAMPAMPSVVLSLAVPAASLVRLGSALTSHSHA